MVQEPLFRLEIKKLMKYFRFRKAACMVAAFALCFSCADDDDFVHPNHTFPNKPEEAHGRFDSKPFEWDEHYSTDFERGKEWIYIGDLNFSVAEKPNKLRRSTPRPNPNAPSSGGEYQSKDILLHSSTGIYIGAAYPKSTFGDSFDKELNYPRNPIDLSFNFPDPYLATITAETGSMGYKKVLKGMVKSDEYKKFVKGKSKKSYIFDCTEFYSYTDIEKAFSANAGVGKFFSGEVKKNSTLKEINGRLFARIISTNFDVEMDLPAKGLFKDKSYNIGAENPVYVKEISYGKLAVIAIESKYTYSQIKEAVEASVGFKIFGGNSNYNKEAQKILSESAVTIYAKSNDSNEYKFGTSFEHLLDAVNITYSEDSYGLPVFCQGRYTKDGSVFYLPQTNSNTNSANSSSIPVNSGSSSNKGGRGSGRG
jgi:hypothetical protein